MAQIPSLEVNIVPHCFNCVSWSSDGDVAIAGEENVHILTPVYEQRQQQHQQHSRTDDVSMATASSPPELRWSQEKFQANIFTEAEWPTITHPAPLATLSVGEELSNSHVTAIAFAPVHANLGSAWRRPVLAVLTANLQLAVWESLDGRKWTRRTTVNGVVSGYFEGLQLGGEGGGLEGRLKQRARSFAWSPACMMNGGGGNDDTKGCAQLPKGDCFLAMGNDCGEVIFLAFNQTNPNVDYGCPIPSVVTHITLSNTDIDATKNPMRAQPMSILGQVTTQRKYISCLAWSEWTFEPSLSAVVSYVALLYGGQLRALRIEKNVESEAWRVGEIEVRFLKGVDDDDDDGDGDEDEDEMILTGPISWDKSGRYFISPIDYKTDDFIVSEIAVAGDGKTVINIHTYRRQHQDRYSPISTIIPVSPDRDTFYIASHLGNVSSVSVPDRHQPPVSNPAPPISRQIDGYRNAYDAKHLLGGNSEARIWGLAPYRLYTNTSNDEYTTRDGKTESRRPEWVCACFTLHPTDLVETSIQSQVMMKIVFAPVESDAEGCNATVIPYGELSMDKIRSARGEVLRYVLQKFLHQQKEVEAHPSAHTDILCDKLIYAASCCAIVAHPEDSRLRALAREVIDMLANRYPNVEFSEERALCDDEHNGNEERRITAKPNADTVPSIVEVCEICGACLMWYDANESQCSEGHIFTRCGLAFLAIQNPYISKACSWCNTEYLNERANLMPQNDTDGGDSPFLMDVCRTFDVCVYCGGKYSV